MKRLLKRFMHKRNRKTEEIEYTPLLTFVDVNNPERTYEYRLEGCMVVGRVPEYSDIALPDEPTVSSRQCRLYTEGKYVYVTDLDGTNTTYLNNKKVTDDFLVRDGDVLGFGNVDFYIRIRD